MEVGKGDIVHVRCKVVDTRPSFGKIAVDVNGTCVIIPADVSVVVHVEPRALAVGDLVTWQSPCENDEIVEIIGVYKAHVWCIDKRGGFSNRYVKDLVRA